jgi:hypothetical protein
MWEFPAISAAGRSAAGRDHLVEPGGDEPEAARAG